MYLIWLRKDMMASSGTEKKHQCLILPTVTKNILIKIKFMMHATLQFLNYLHLNYANKQ